MYGSTSVGNFVKTSTIVVKPYASVTEGGGERCAVYAENL